MVESTSNRRSGRSPGPVSPPGFDPAAQPWISADVGWTAISPACLTADALRRILAPENVWTAQLPLIKDTRVQGNEGALVLAAVLVALMMHPDGVKVLLTRRTSHLHDHAGQIAFPGGRIETSDASPTDAALREAAEETGLPRAQAEILGVMPDYLTKTGFAITPVVSLVRPGFDFAPDVFEVEEIFEVPLAFLMDPANHRLHHADLPDGNSREYYGMLWDRHFIWGATAAMLRNFYHLLHAAQSSALSVESSG